MNAGPNQGQRESNRGDASLWDRLDCSQLGSLVRQLAAAATADHVSDDAARNGGTLLGARSGRIEL